MKVFIGSSNEEVEDLELLASWVEEFGHEPIPWNDLSVFTPGSYTFSSLVELTKRVDAAIFIFSEDDKVWYRSDTAKQPRDNVMIEYGLFLGALGEGRVIFCRKGCAKTASDLLGVVYVNINNNKKSAAKIQIRSWLTSLKNKELPDSAIKSFERLNSPFQALGKRTLFMRGTELMKGAQERVALVARTPIPLVGTRPYGSVNHTANYEKEQLDCFWELMDRSLTESKPQIRCVTCPTGTAEVIKTVNSDSFNELVISNLDKFYEYIEKNEFCQLLYSKCPSSLTYLVADDNFIVWFKDGAGESVWITANNDSVADALYDLANREVEQLNIDDIKVKLNLN
jgi:hypothetical protein